jgi:hypothetical protein
MRILFDQGRLAPLRRELVGHDVKTAFETGWSELTNGALLRMGEAQFDAFITTDKNLGHQQNLSGMRLAILVLPTTSWPRIQQHIPEVVAAANALKPGDFVELRFSNPSPPTTPPAAP